MKASETEGGGWVQRGGMGEMGGVGEHESQSRW